MKIQDRNFTLNAGFILAIGLFTFMGANPLRAQIPVATARDAAMAGRCIANILPMLP